MGWLDKPVGNPSDFPHAFAYLVYFSTLQSLVEVCSATSVCKAADSIYGGWANTKVLFFGFHGLKFHKITGGCRLVVVSNIPP